MGNPALEAFIAALSVRCVLAQVQVRQVRRGGNSFESRHVADSDQPEAQLRLVPVSDLRQIALFSASGVFRPLKSAPNLVTGWRTIAADEHELGLVLDQIYPGGIADWFAARRDPPPVTSYREFTARQTGMYRIAATLDDQGVAGAIGECCHVRCCLKRRLWTVEGVAIDAPDEKSLLACLEPCALMLDAARVAARRARSSQRPEGSGPIDGALLEDEPLP